MAGKFTRGALIAGLGLIIGAAAAPGVASAGASASNCGCHTPTPPPPPPPPSPPCCSPPPVNTVNIPGVEVNVGGSVIVESQVNVQAGAAATAASQSYYGGNGGAAGGIIPPMATGYIQGLGVGAGQSSYEATRTLFKKVVIQAFCFDDKLSPHPASQVFPDRDVDDAFDGELYRCIAGTHMQVTIADWSDHYTFEGGKTLTCQKGEALYHGPGTHGGILQCRPQHPARDCNERSLLRRFGPGIKVLTMIVTERYTAYRQESSSSTAATAMSLDGGVGGFAY